jgi:hypothetical protein
MDLETASRFINKSVKIKPRDNFKSHIIAKLISINKNNKLAEVKPKNHKRSEFVHIKNLLTWKKGQLMNNEDFMDDKDDKFVIIAYKPELVFYKSIDKWSHHYLNSKLYDNSANAKRALGRMRRKLSDAKVVSFPEAKEIYTECINKSNSDYHDINNINIKQEDIKQENAEHYEFSVDEVLDDIHEVLNRRYQLISELNQIDDDLKELNDQKELKIKELNEVVNKIQASLEFLPK